eukprot:2659898-Ditylum_brightwellii.AAC.1
MDESSSSSSWSPSSKAFSSSDNEEDISTKNDTAQEEQKRTLSSTTTTSPETIWECLKRLHQQKQLYRGAGPVNNDVFKTSNSLGKSLLASSFAGVMNVLLTNPLWVANLRIVQGNSLTKNRAQQNQSLWLEIMEIAKQEGILQLWSGTTASLLLVSNPAIQHFLYDVLKSKLIVWKQQRQRQQRGRGSMSSSGGGKGMALMRPLEAFIIGAIAKAIATIVTYPMQLAQ